MGFIQVGGGVFAVEDLGMVYIINIYYKGL